MVQRLWRLLLPHPPPTSRRWCMDALSDRLRMGATAEGFLAAERTLQ